MTWEFSWLCIAGAVLCGGIYAIVRQLRRFVAWAQRTEPPRERAAVYVLFCAVLGFSIGGFSTPLYQRGVWCSQQGVPPVQCAFSARQ